MENNRESEFLIERGHLASKAMTSKKFRDIYIKLGVVKSEVSGGLRTYSFSDHISLFDEEDFDNALQGASESVIDGLYEAYAEMQDGSYDAMEMFKESSDEERANSFDGTYNKNAIETIRNSLTPNEIVSSFIDFREDGERVKASEAGNLERE